MDTAPAARELAVRGWSIIPVHAVAQGRCTCGRPSCPSPGKHPRVRWEAFQHDAPSGAQLDEWWCRWPDANLAVVTGRVSGLIVVDVDPRHGGDATLDVLEDRWGALPPTVESSTGGGGRHLFFGAPEERLVSAPLMAGIDLKAEGGTAVLPPSLHESGRRYAWVPGRAPSEAELADLPGWLVVLGRGDVSPEATRRHPLGAPPARTGAEQQAFAEAWDRAGIDLRPGDRTYLCPFHADHHPSLHIDADGCRWFCFGCGRGGGIGRLLRLLGDEPPARPLRQRRATEPIGPVALRGDEVVQVAGEGAHQGELLRLAGQSRPYGGVSLDVVARLVPAGHDDVVVEIEHHVVGRLRPRDASIYRPLVEEAEEQAGQATCRAQIRGGWDRGGSDVGQLGVRLWLPRRSSVR